MSTNSKLIQLYSDESKTELRYPITRNECVLNDDGSKTFEKIEKKITCDISDLKDNMSNTYGNDINDMKQEVNKDKNINDEVTRKTNTLLKMGKGITHEFITDEEKGYCKRIPSGAKLASVKKIGGRSLVWNQLAVAVETRANINGIIRTNISNYAVHIEGTSTNYTLYSLTKPINFIKNHTYFCKINKNLNLRIGFDTVNRVDKSIINKFTSNTQLTFGIKVPVGTAIDEILIPQIFDLTKMFGYGNEPTQEEFEVMLNNEYYEYNTGTLINFPTEKIIQKGINLINIDDYYGKYKQKDGTYCGGIDDIASINIPLSQYKGHTVIFSAFLMCPKDATNILVSYKDSIVGHKYGNYISSGTTGWSTVIVDNITDDGRVNITYENTTGHMTYFSNIMLLLDNDSSVYSPYKETIYNLPQELLNLNGFGLAVPNCFNEIDLDNKQYIQRVSSYTFTGYEKYHKWTDSIDENTQLGIMVNNPMTDYDITSKDGKNFLCDKLTSCTPASSIHGNISFRGDNDGIYLAYLPFIKSTMTTSEEIINWLRENKPTVLYKLKTPIITDISNLIPEGFLEALEVEENGSLTFKSSSFDLFLPIPSTEEYITKLQLSSN